MTMRGIDISNHQGKLGFELENVINEIDFCIMKATGGNSFVDPYCDKWVQTAIANGLPWGFYHYANDCGYNDAIVEAHFFVENCRNYFGYGIPVLDYEVDYDNVNGVSWCEEFLAEVHDLTGVWPILYISALNGWCVPTFDGSWIPDKCGLWIAGYPYYAKTWTDEKLPYSISPWQICAIWQFTSTLNLNGFWDGVDGNIAYMDIEAWMKYANAKPQLQPVLDEKKLIKQILNGEWGNDGERRKRLQSSGYDADYIQEKINELYDVAQECIEGKWGNGWNREQALSGAGYDFETVQTIVNAIMGLR